jgi:hypothetical protein
MSIPFLPHIWKHILLVLFIFDILTEVRWNFCVICYHIAFLVKDIRYFFIYYRWPCLNKHLSFFLEKK